ncbi:MAG: discoidin domain-containing protein, partial [Bacteroidaceae bacterium]|nr:discoidin domain-containing protein [Bacteroidaceae bacterium]
QSTQVIVDETLDPVESEIAFNYSSKSEEHGYIITMARADQNSGYTLLHQGGHGGGVNNSGNIVGWEAAADASTWYLIPVEEAVAEKMIEDYAPIRDRDAMLASVAEMAASGSNMLDIARDLQTVEVNMEMPLISEPTQFSSPMTTTDTQCPTIEEVYPYLLDGNTTTYWHSRWEDGDRPNGTHYLQVELTEPEAVTGAAIQFTRRAVANDHVIEWGVYGTNDPEAEKGACEKLGVLATPFTSNTETILTGGFETKGYKYIRFYINNTTTGRGYGHVSEFQMYAATVAANPTSQMVMLGELSTNLQAAIAAIPAEQENITTEHYTALKAAYEAFIAKFVDPTALRAAIASAENAAKNVVIGNQPGFWSEGATDEFDAVMAEVKAYDKGGVYETAKSEEWIAGLDAAVKAMYGKANQISTDKWYYLHFSTEEMYDTNKWNKTPATDTITGLGNLFGQFVSAGIYHSIEGDNNDEIETLNSEIAEGTSLYYTEFNGDAGSQFRFIAVGDTAYVIQNKANGLFINCAGANNSNVTLSLNPTTFKISAIGQGLNVIHGMSLNGTNLTYLHAQLANHKLVSWNANTLGSNSALMIQEAEAVTEEPENVIVRNIRPGKIYAQCYPVAVGTEEGMYTVAGTFTENEKNYLALNAIEKAEAGEPYIYIYGETTDYAEPAEGEEAVT